MVSYARSTYEKSRRFHEMLKELQKTISPVMIRTYLAAANKQKDDDVELSLNINEEQKARLDELNKLRMDGIRSEMKYALAQAEKNGDTVIRTSRVRPGNTAWLQTGTFG